MWYISLYNLHHKSIRVQHWGFHFLDPPRALGARASAAGLHILVGHAVLDDVVHRELRG